MNGKGDKPRPIDNPKEYEENLNRIFGKKCRYNHVHDQDCEGSEPPPPVKEEKGLEEGQAS